MQRLANIESRTEDNVERYKEFDAEKKRQFKEEDLPMIGDKASPEYWAKNVG